MDKIRAECKRLLEESRYNKAILPQLQEAVTSQIQDGWYDLELNLAVLKIYQFNPEESVVDLPSLCKVLCLALMNSQGSDFQLCMYLVPAVYQQKEEVQTLVKLCEHLETAQFKQLWTLLGASPQVIQLAPGMEDALVKVVLRTMQLTYAEMPVDVLGELINRSGVQLDKALSTNDISCKGGVAYFPKTENNQEKALVSETMQLPQFSSLLSTLA